MTEAEIAALVARNQQLEADLARVTQNRDSILQEKKALELRRSGDDEAERAIRLADRYLKGQINLGVDGYQTDKVTISRAEARDPQAYQKAKATAEERKVPLVITDNHVDPALSGHARPAQSTVRYVEDEKTYYAHQEMQREVGLLELDRRAREKGKILKVFKSVEDLSPDARARHDRIVAEADPDNLLLKSE